MCFQHFTNFHNVRICVIDARSKLPVGLSASVYISFTTTQLECDLDEFFFFFFYTCEVLIYYSELVANWNQALQTKKTVKRKYQSVYMKFGYLFPPAPYIFKYVFDRLQTAGVKVDGKSVSTHGSRWKRSLQKETAAWCECTSSAQRNPTKHVTGCVNRTVRDNRSRQELPSTATVEKQHRVCEYFTGSVYRLPSFRNV